MQRREMQKAIKSYAKSVGFYKYGLIRQLLKLKERRWSYLKAELRNKEVLCPNCGEDIMEVEYSDCEYNSDTYLSCGYCGECLDCGDSRVEAYLDIYDRLNCEAYFDSLENEVYFGECRGSGYKWEQYCEKEIKKLLAEGLGV